MIDLPEPSLPFIKRLQTAKVSDSLEEASPPHQPAVDPPENQKSSSSPSKSRRLQRDSLENLDADPWGSPALHKGHTHPINNEVTPTNSTTSARPLGRGVLAASRTTSNFTTHAEDPTSNPASAGEITSGEPPVDESGGGWGSYGAPVNEYSATIQPELSGEDFGSGGNDQRNNPGRAAGRSIGGGRNSNRGNEETVTVTLLPEKEGMFFFQHHNYEVKSTRKASTVIRRYSDFVWLLDCLHKRYPFRQLPLLPPKRVAGEIIMLFRAPITNQHGRN